MTSLTVKHRHMIAVFSTQPALSTRQRIGYQDTERQKGITSHLLYCTHAVTPGLLLARSVQIVYAPHQIQKESSLTGQLILTLNPPATLCPGGTFISPMYVFNRITTLYTYLAHLGLFEKNPWRLRIQENELDRGSIQYIAMDYDFFRRGTGSMLSGGKSDI